MKLRRLVAAVMIAVLALSVLAMTAVAEDEKPEVSIAAIDTYSGMSNTGEYAGAVKAALEEITGTTMNIEWIQDAETQISLMLAQPMTMSQVIYHWNLTASIVSAAENGAFIDLNDYIWDAEKYPYLSQINENTAKLLSVGGKLIGIPRTRVIGRNGLSYRKDWAEAVGITKDPETIDDVYEMLYKFTYEDPDGNGKDDTYGLDQIAYTGSFDVIQTWFGCGNGWADVDGKLVPVHMQEEYLEALNWIKNLYDEGLMPADWAVRGNDTIRKATMNGETGVFIDVMDNGRAIWDYYVDSKIPSVVNPDEYASMALVGPINGRTTATTGYNGFATLSASTCDTPEKIEAALTMLDRLNTNEAKLLMTYGLEGISWETGEDGYLVDLDIDNTALSASYQGFGTMLFYLPDYDNTTDPGEQVSDRVKAQNEAYARNLDCAVFNPATSYLLNSETYAGVGSMLDDWVKQARSQYICGEISEEELKAVWEKWYDNGGAQIIDEVNAQYVHD